MGRIYDVVAIVGEYQDNSGQKKLRYKNAGVVIESEGGKRYLKLEALPFNESGGLVNFFSLFEPKERGAKQGPAALPQSVPAAQPEFNDDLPDWAK